MALPKAGGLLYGIKAAILAVVTQALWGLGRNALRTKPLALLGAVTIAACALGVHELVVLFGGGLIVALACGAIPPGVVAADLAPPWRFRPRGPSRHRPRPALSLFLKTGSVLFGSGHVLLAYLRVDVVDRWG